MHSSSLLILSLSVLAHGHGVILAAQGSKGSVASQGFLVNNTLARNCTDISPCQQDSTIIRDNEITQNIVNGCGRTELAGNIDIGEQTENELAAKRVTSVTQGLKMQVTIHQVNADGAGPYECDIDQTSNAGNFTPIKVTNNVPGSNGLSQAKFQNFNINVELPQDMNCIGASTGNICTVRCRNNALAGPFGGCFAVMQTDTSGRTNETAAGVPTAQTADDIAAQILVNQQQLGEEVQANINAGAAGNPGLEAVQAAGATNPTDTTNGNQNANANANQNANGNANANAGAAANQNGNANANANANTGAAANQNANGKANAGAAANQNAGAAANQNANAKAGAATNQNAGAAANQNANAKAGAAANQNANANANAANKGGKNNNRLVKGREAAAPARSKREVSFVA